MRGMTPRLRTLLVPLLVAAVACGGSKKSADEPSAGETHAGGVIEGEPTPVAGDVVQAQGTPTTEIPTQQPPDAGLPAVPQLPYAIELRNSGETDVVFAIDKGWQPVIFAYTGKSPKAKSALLFPTYCTESCETATELMCPVCKEPELPKDRQKAEKLETKREVAPAGSSFKLDWDGKIYAYEKAPPEARAKKKKCQCWRKVDPPADTYTIKACGLRPSPKPGESSRPVCVESQVQLPAATVPSTITLDFAK